MEYVVKLCMLGIIIALVGVYFRDIKKEYTIFIGIGFALICGYQAVKLFEAGLEKLEWIRRVESYGNYLGVLFKMVFITYLSEFTVSICKESGFQTIATQIEICAKLILFVIGIPVAESLVKIVGELLG